MGANLQRYIFGLIGVVLIIVLVIIDKTYITEQPIPERAYRIVSVFILGCMIGADNLTNIVSLFIKKFIGNETPN